MDLVITAPAVTLTLNSARLSASTVNAKGWRINLFCSPDTACSNPMLSTWPESIQISVSSAATPSFADLQIDGTSAWRIPDAAPNVEWIEVKCSAH